MSAPAVARNYAEVLFALGESGGQSVHYGELIDAVADAIASSPELALVLHSPRVPKSEKAGLFTRPLTALPTEFVRFLEVVVQRGRQGAIGAIATAYQALLDDKLNRVRAHVTLAREPNDALREAVRAALSTTLQKEVVPSFGTDAAILGGAIVKVGDRIYDGSVRRRMAKLRRAMV